MASSLAPIAAGDPPSYTQRDCPTIDRLTDKITGEDQGGWGSAVQLDGDLIARHGGERPLRAELGDQAVD